MSHETMHLLLVSETARGLAVPGRMPSTTGCIGAVLRQMLNVKCRIAPRLSVFSRQNYQ